MDLPADDQPEPEEFIWLTVDVYERDAELAQIFIDHQLVPGIYDMDGYLHHMMCKGMIEVLTDNNDFEAVMRVQIEDLIRRTKDFLEHNA